MEITEFLFPTGLRVTETSPRRVLIMGACTAEALVSHLLQRHGSVKFDYLVCNGLNDMTPEPPRDIDSYDFCIIDASFRDVVGDGLIFVERLAGEGELCVLRERALIHLRQCLSSLLGFNRRHGLTSFVLNWPAPQRSLAAALDQVGTSLDPTRLWSDLNLALADIVGREHRNAYVLDAEAIGAALGKRFYLDDMLNFYAHSGVWNPAEVGFDTDPEFGPRTPRIEPVHPLTDLYLSEAQSYHDALWAGALSLWRSIRQIDQVKLVVFDLDNTLWRGTLAEDYGEGQRRPVPDGWPIGVWEAVHHLKARGVLTAIISKNDPELVTERWDRAVFNRWIHHDDFVVSEIGWGEKAEAMLRVLHQTGLTARSVLYVDDSPVERLTMEAAHPGVRTLGGDPHEVRRLLLWSAELRVPRLSAEARARPDAMAAQVQRERVREGLSRADFLSSLQLRVEVRDCSEPADPRWPRALELLNRTNQFNTTGERWTEAGLRRFSGSVVVWDVADRFTDYGVSGAALVEAGCVRQLVMSCRVIGLGVETQVLEWLLANGNVKQAALVETAGNAVCRKLYADAGWTAQDERLWLAPEGRPPLPDQAASAPRSPVDEPGAASVSATASPAARRTLIARLWGVAWAAARSVPRAGRRRADALVPPSV